MSECIIYISIESAKNINKYRNKVICELQKQKILYWIHILKTKKNSEIIAFQTRDDNVKLWNGLERLRNNNICHVYSGHVKKHQLLRTLSKRSSQFISLTSLFTRVFPEFDFTDAFSKLS